MKQSFRIIFSVLFGDRFFQLNGRAGLLEFWLIFIIYGILALVAFVITSPDSFIKKLLFFFVIFMQPWILWSLAVRRFHDLNLRGWWILTILPLIVLPFLPGKKEQNRFDVED